MGSICHIDLPSGRLLEMSSDVIYIAVIISYSRSCYFFSVQHTLSCQGGMLETCCD